MQLPPLLTIALWLTGAVWLVGLLAYRFGLPSEFVASISSSAASLPSSNG